MIDLALWYLAITATCFGLGATGLRLLGLRLDQGLAPIFLADIGIFGAFLCFIIGNMVNVGFALDGEFQFGLRIVGCLLCAVQTPWLVQALGQRKALSLTLFVILSAGGIVQNILLPIHFDTGLYHLQAILWPEQGMRVLGIANIHSRLAFNSAWFGFAEAVDSPLSGHRPVFLINQAMVAMIGLFLAELLGTRLHSYPGRAGRMVGILVLLLFAGISVDFLYGEHSASPSNDTPAALMVLYGVCRFLLWYDYVAAYQPVDDSKPAVAPLFLLGFAVLFAITIKLSALPLSLLVVVALVAQTRRFGTTTIATRGALFLISALAVWLIAGFASSGCWIYPMRASCFPAVPWQVPLDSASEMVRVIQGWARAPRVGWEERMDHWLWLDDWRTLMLPNRPFFTRTLMIFSGFAIAAVVVTCFRRFSRPTSFYERLAMMTVTGVAWLGVAFWLWSAPDPRFGFGFIVAAPLLTFAFFMTKFRFFDTDTLAPGIRFAVIGLLVTVVAINTAESFPAASAKASSWPQIPLVPWHIVQSLQNVPYGLSDLPPGICAASPVPCSPQLEDGLTEGMAGPWRYYGNTASAYGR